MNVNYKKVKNSLFLTLLTFSLGTFCVFPATTSKYYTYDDSHLVYNVKYKELTNREVTLVNDEDTTSAPETLGLIGTFYRSNYVLNTDKNVKYTFSVDSGCKIVKVSGSKGTFNKENKTLIYSKANIDSDLNAPIQVYYTCDADSIRKDNELVPTFKVTEQFKSDGSSKYENKIYEIGETTRHFIYDNFLKPYEKEGIIYIPKTYKNNFYSYIVQKMNAEEVKYFKTKYLSDDSNIKENNILPGFEVSENEDFYIYTRNEDFSSYVSTYNYNSNGKYFYFLNEKADNDKLISMFTYYIENYTNYDEQDKLDLINYITNSEPSLKEVLDCNDGTKNIGGVYHRSNTRWIEIKDTIWLYIHPPLNSVVEIDYSAKNTDITQKLRVELETTLGLSNSNILYDRDVLLVSKLLDNPTEETYTYLKPYVDGDRTIIAYIHAVPGTTPGTGVKYLYVEEVKAGKSHLLSFTPIRNADGTTINIQDTVIKINEYLGYFETDFVVDEAMLNSPDNYDMISINENGIITISFISRTTGASEGNGISDVNDSTINSSGTGDGGNDENNDSTEESAISNQ